LWKAILLCCSVGCVQDKYAIQENGKFGEA
jgi:hypothetical protein